MTSLELAIAYFAEARAKADHWQLRTARRQLEDALKSWCPYEDALADYERANMTPSTQRFVDLAKQVMQ